MTVDWRPEARDEFARIYVALTLIEQRVLGDTVEREMANDPFEHGEDRGVDGLGRLSRFRYAPPLGIHYAVGAAGVEIVSVRTRATPR